MHADLFTDVVSDAVGVLVGGVLGMTDSALKVMKKMHWAEVRDGFALDVASGVTQRFAGAGCGGRVSLSGHDSLLPLGLHSSPAGR